MTNVITDSVTAEAAESNSPEISVRRLAGHIGAEISGVDLSQPLDDAVIAKIRRKLLKYKVVFFRDQEIGHAEQIAFARRFGELTHAHPHEDAPPAEFPEILTIDPRRYEQKYGENFREQYTKRRYTYYAGWHTDVTAAVNPPAASLLRAETVPSYGGDTTWTNQVAAYEGLSEPLRKLVDGLRAEHRFRAGQERGDEDDELSRRIQANLLVSVHPVVRVHPETGEKALFVNPGFTTRILDLSAVESRKLLELLFEHLTRPEYTVRFKWEPGSLAFWDNRATAHLGPQDLDHLDVERVLHRVTLIGDRPVGPTGFTSEIVAGEEFRATANVKIA
ncbi:TauD/TfdA dioxygenase family protein [Nocardia sp. CA-151230]|uniref:TauD/TfdA dioxygenase family protein n=1 Tax=Nocardia sp. CA-151230 TaxID=3239982 RepID=UPI003D90E53E